MGTSNSTTTSQAQNQAQRTREAIYVPPIVYPLSELGLGITGPFDGGTRYEIVVTNKTRFLTQFPRADETYIRKVNVRITKACGGQQIIDEVVIGGDNAPYYENYTVYSTSVNYSTQQVDQTYLENSPGFLLCKAFDPDGPNAQNDNIIAANFLSGTRNGANINVFPNFMVLEEKGSRAGEIHIDTLRDTVPVRDTIPIRIPGDFVEPIGGGGGGGRQLRVDSGNYVFQIDLLDACGGRKTATARVNIAESALDPRLKLRAIKDTGNAIETVTPTSGGGRNETTFFIKRPL